MIYGLRYHIARMLCLQASSALPALAIDYLKC